MKKSRTVLLAVLVLFVGIISTIVYVGVVRGQDSDRFRDEIDRLEKALQSPGLSEEEREDLLSSLKSVAAEATHRASGHVISTQKAAGVYTPPARKEVFIPTEEPATSIKIPDGIDNDPFIPLPIFGYDKHTKVLNSWKKTAEEGYFLVYAGYMTDDQKQGMVLIQTNDSIFFSRYLTPKRSGPVRIVAEHNLYLTLQAENGDIFYFDASGERFIDSLDAPTVTPAPPYPAP